MRITKHTLKHYSPDTRLKNVVYKYAYHGDRLVWTTTTECTLAEALDERKRFSWSSGYTLTCDATLA